MHALYLVVPALAILAIAYRYYSAFIATRIWMLDDSRATPAHTKYDGANYYPTTRWVLFGHHFAAITGAGPLVGPMLAAQFGWAPGFIWLVAGVCLAGRRARLDDPVGLDPPRRPVAVARSSSEEIGPLAGFVASIAILFIVVVALAGLGIIVVNALADSAWGTFTIAMTIPHRHVHGASGCTCGGRAASPKPPIIGVIAMLLAVVGGEPLNQPGLVARELLPSVAYRARHRAVRLRLRRVGAAGVAAAVAARLSELVHEDRHDLPARRRRHHRQSRAPDAGADRVRRRRRADHRRARCSPSASSPSPAARSPASMRSSARAPPRRWSTRSRTSARSATARC